MGDRRQVNGKEGEVAISVLDKDSLGRLFDHFIVEESCGIVSAPPELLFMFCTSCFHAMLKFLLL